MATPSSRRATQLVALAGFLVWPAVTAAAPSRAEMDVAVRELGGDHDRATAARYELQAGGREAAAAIREGWSTMSPLARQRAVPALRILAPNHDEAVDALVEAARSGDETLAERALQALAASAARGREGMIRLIVDPSVGERAAELLARSAPDLAIEPLLLAMSAAGGPDRPGLRDALAVAAQRAESPRAALLAWLGTSPPAAAVASAAFGLAALERVRDVLTSFVEYAVGRSGDFPTSWRLLRSAGAAGPSASIDGWAERQIRDAEPWMLRAAAVDAVTARGERQHAREALADPYPRVRARAASALSGDPSTLLARSTRTFPSASTSATIAISTAWSTDATVRVRSPDA